MYESLILGTEAEILAWMRDNREHMPLTASIVPSQRDNAKKCLRTYDVDFAENANSVADENSVARLWVKEG